MSKERDEKLREIEVKLDYLARFVFSMLYSQAPKAVENAREDYREIGLEFEEGEDG